MNWKGTGVGRAANLFLEWAESTEVAMNDWTIVVIYTLVIFGQFLLRRHDRKNWKQELASNR
jgi:hypothetical protein